MDPQPIDPGSSLDQAAERLFAAFADYRAFVKRHHRERLAGVMWVRRGPELIVYSECERYAHQLLALTFDPARDAFMEVEGTETGSGDG